MAILLCKIGPVHMPYVSLFEDSAAVKESLEYCTWIHVDRYIPSDFSSASFSRLQP